MSNLNNNAQNQKQTPEETKRRLSPAALAILAGVAAVVVIGVIAWLAIGSSGGSVETVLQNYYESLYARGDLAGMAECLTEGTLRDDFRKVYTLGGVSNLAASNALQATEWVGENVTVDVDVIERERPSAALLNAVRSENGAVESVTDAAFLITLTGDTGTRTLRGTGRLVKIGGKWYVNDYNMIVTPVDTEQ